MPVHYTTTTPRGATRTGNTVAPSCSMASDTRGFAPRSTRKKTHPPPPAPQTFAPTAPAGRVACDQPVDQRRRDPGRVLLAVGPLLPQQPRHFVPIGLLQRLPHGARDLRDAVEIAVHGAVAVDVAPS